MLARIDGDLDCSLFALAFDLHFFPVDHDDGLWIVDLDNQRAFVRPQFQHDAQKHGRKEQPGDHGDGDLLSTARPPFPGLRQRGHSALGSAVCPSIGSSNNPRLTCSEEVSTLACFRLNVSASEGSPGGTSVGAGVCGNAACVSDAITSPIVCGRSSGRLANIFWKRPSTHSGTSGLAERSDGTGCSRCARIFFVIVSPANGGRPVSR